jgi:hypothetical protein
MEPLASIENSKRDHTIYLDNEKQGIFFSTKKYPTD